MVDPPSGDAPSQVTHILGQLQAGEREAAEQLLPLLYGDLRKLAAARMQRLAPGQTMQATELVHDAYMRLVGSTDPGWQGRAHFFGAAAEAMRRILIDRYRHKKAVRHGGDLLRVTLSDAEAPVSADIDQIIDLDNALKQFGEIDPHKAELVKLHLFAGLTLKESAAAMEISYPTAKRHWSYAKAWLSQHLEDSPS